MAFVVIGFIDNSVDFGFASAIIQRKKISSNEYSSCFWLLAISGFFAAALLYFAAPVFGSMFKDHRLDELLHLLALAMLAMPVQILYRAILNRELRLVQLAKVDLWGLFIRSGVTLALAIYGFGAWSIVLGFTMEKILVAATLLFVTGWLPSIHLSRQELAPFVGFGMKITLGRIVYFFLSRVDIIIVGRLLGAEILGVYNLAMQFANVVSQLIVSTGINVAYPLFSRYRDTEQFLPSIYRSEQFVAAIALPALAGLFITAHDLISLALGDTWQEVATYLQFLCIATMLQVISFLLPQAINAANRTMVNVYINGASVIGYSIVLASAGYCWGIKGILGSLIALSAARFVAMLVAAHRILQIKTGIILRDLAEVGLVTLLMVATIYAVASMLPAHLGSAIRLPIMIGTGVATYVSLQLLMFRHKTVEMYRLTVGR